MCQVATVVMETTQLVLSQLKNFMVSFENRITSLYTKIISKCCEFVKLCNINRSGQGFLKHNVDEIYTACENYYLKRPVGKPANDVDNDDGRHEPRDLPSSHLSTAVSPSCRSRQPVWPRPGVMGRYPAPLEFNDKHGVEDGDEGDWNDEADYERVDDVDASRSTRTAVACRDIYLTAAFSKTLVKYFFRASAC